MPDPFFDLLPFLSHSNRCLEEKKKKLATLKVVHLKVQMVIFASVPLSSKSHVNVDRNPLLCSKRAERSPEFSLYISSPAAAPVIANLP